MVLLKSILALLAAFLSCTGDLGISCSFYPYFHALKLFCFDDGVLACLE